jgi:hypothetical protein
MKRLAPMLLVFGGALTPQAFAKAYFQTKQEMIKKAEAIAIVTILEVQSTQTKGGHWTYAQAGTAKVEQVLKGKLPDQFTLHGSEDFICARCPIAKGRFLAFLKQDGDLWAGSNWQSSLRPIEGDRVEWYVEDQNRYEFKLVPIEDVIAEIRAILDQAREKR